ncbi:autotransporter outer membrane beta-barrel domain-containing protein [Brucella oryzae]|uniref:autotransporter outer membrane beta-barrel domain-containing protein n=1 Tax=Brucella oryzae TaxID=335286 RepID=UPI0035BBD5D7
MSVAWALGLLAGATLSVKGAAAQEPQQIPLEYVYGSYNYNGAEQHYVSRLGIWVGIGDGKAQRFLFDTGSDQFNAAIGKDANVNDIAGAPKKYYVYNDGTNGYVFKPVSFDKLTYFNKDGTASVVTQLGSLQAAKILDTVFTKVSPELNGERLSDEAVCISSTTPGDMKCYAPGELDKGKIALEYHADLDARSKIEAGERFEEKDSLAGTFGAGDFLMSNSIRSSPLAGMTRTGFVVAANGNSDYAENGATPGCSPCIIVNLNSGLRAQFVSTTLWGNQNREGFEDKFPGAQGDASTQFEGGHTLTVTPKSGNYETLAADLPVLLDTGTPGAGTIKLGEGTFDKLLNDGVIRETEKGSGKYEMDLSLAASGGDAVSLQSVDVSKISRADPDYDEGKIEFIAGLDFFLSQSVVYDFEKKTTAYTPYFVSADNFTTDSGGLNLSQITRKMGSQVFRDRLDENGKPVVGSDGNPVQDTYGLLGLAGSISGSGSLTLDPYTDVRMTNINTYTGETVISANAYLSLAGLGGIEQSARVAVNGSLDISEHGNANKYWGIDSAQNDVRIRSLSGMDTGAIGLGDRNLILTAANDVFAGSISDFDDSKNHGGGGLVIAAGVQTLSGSNDYSGLTTVNQGAGLLLAKAGAITHDVVTSGLLGNDGKIGGTVKTGTGGIIAGYGTFGAVTVTDGGTIAPGSVLDANEQITKLTVTGSFAQQSGSTYEVGLAKSADFIDIGGNATIDSAAQVNLIRQGAIAANTRYTLLTAAAGVNGTYGGLTGTLATDSPFVDFNLVYDPKNVYLDVSRTSTAFADIADTFNQRSTAVASETLGVGDPVYDNILALTEQESRDALDQLSGEIYASMRGVLIEDSHFVRDAAIDRIRSAFEEVGASDVPVMAYGPGGIKPVAANTEGPVFWGRGYGAWGLMKDNGNAARLDYSTGGFLAGVDASMAETWRAGLLVGYSHTSFDVDDRRSTGSSANYHLGAYAGTHWDNIGFRSGLAYTWHRVDAQRGVGFPEFSDNLESSYNAGTFQAFAEMGYHIDTKPVAFEPYVNLAYVHLKTEDFNETGGAAALSGESQSQNVTFSTLGLRASSGFDIGTVAGAARGGLGWRHAFGDKIPEATFSFADSSLFDIKGVPLAEDTALVEAGVDLNLTDQIVFGFSYQGQITSNAQEHGFNAKLTASF